MTMKKEGCNQGLRKENHPWEYDFWG